MSGLEKFQANEVWRKNFKKFLFMERKPDIVQNSVELTESQRYSLDIGEDLKNIIEQNKNKKTVQLNLNEEVINYPNIRIQKRQAEINKSYKENMEGYNDTVSGEVPIWQKTSDDSFELLEKMCEKTASDPNSTLFKYLRGEIEQKSNNLLPCRGTHDESFEAIERMCDKTASDPNNTLFQYLRGDRKEHGLAEAKKRTPAVISINCEDQLLMKLNNCTLLDEVEAPSRLWENTICDDTIQQTSPVKMVGLLRPSTIIEEAPDDSANSELSSHISFCTATKTTNSEVSSSSTYETAHDSTIASSQTNYSNKFQTKNNQEINVDEILFATLEKNKQNQRDGMPFLAKANTTIDGLIPNECENSSITNMSQDLVKLEKTIDFPQNFPNLSILKKNKPLERAQQYVENDENKLNESVIEILSDDDENEDADEKNLHGIHNNEHYIQTEICLSSFDINDTHSLNESEETDKENCMENEEPSEKSIQFNDTMEEVEYLMKKGMEYIAAEAAGNKSSDKKQERLSKNIYNKDNRTQQNSPLKRTITVKHLSSSSSKVKSSVYITPAVKISTTTDSSATSKRFNIDIRPFPKLDIFAKPLVHSRTKESKQQKFSHIVSPVGTYMKKTAQTPLMSSMNYKTKDYFNSSAIQELENESRLYQPQFGTVFHGKGEKVLPELPGITTDVKRVLPKKAYISSGLKHIVYERIPVTIPGGKKIKKYLENAMIPAVLRHEGKFKISGNIKNKSNTLTSSSSGAHSKLPLKVTDTNLRDLKSTEYVSSYNNASLGDLSLMSGDISMYTIMDAKKF